MTQQIWAGWGVVVDFANPPDMPKYYISTRISVTSGPRGRTVYWFSKGLIEDSGWTEDGGQWASKV